MGKLVEQACSSVQFHLPEQTQPHKSCRKPIAWERRSSPIHGVARWSGIGGTLLSCLCCLWVDLGHSNLSNSTELVKADTAALPIRPGSNMPPSSVENTKTSFSASNSLQLISKPKATDPSAPVEEDTWP